MADPDKSVEKTSEREVPAAAPPSHASVPAASASKVPVAPSSKHLPVGPPSEPFFEAQKQAAEAAVGRSSERQVSAPSLGELKAKAEADLAAAEQEAAAHAGDPVVRESARDVAAGAPRSSQRLEAAKSVSQAAPTSSSLFKVKPEDARPIAAYELLARSARLADVVALTSRIVGDAARARTHDWVFTSKVSSAAGEMKLTREDADTRFGNALDVLGTGGEGEAERALACALWAHAVAESPRKEAADEDRLAGDVLWLATHTAFDATSLLDRALGDEAADLWVAIADRVKRIANGRGGAVGRGEAVVGAAALASSGSAKAKALCASLAKEVKDPVLLRVLATGDHATPEEVRLEGEWLPAPRGLVATTLLAFTGVLFALYTARMVARLALAYRRPTEISLSESGVRVKTRIEMLGRVLREREHVILRTGLVRVVREVRFPRVAFYAGLLALAIGSFVGVRAFVDGVRAASPSLLLVGLVVVALGIGLDFVLGTVLPGSRGRVRIAFVPRTGATVCVGNIDAQRADDALSRSLGRS